MVSSIELVFTVPHSTGADRSTSSAARSHLPRSAAAPFVACRKSQRVRSGSGPLDRDDELVERTHRLGIELASPSASETAFRSAHESA